MADLGQNRKAFGQSDMSAFTQTADVASSAGHVRSVPEAVARPIYLRKT